MVMCWSKTAGQRCDACFGLLLWLDESTHTHTHTVPFIFNETPPQLEELNPRDVMEICDVVASKDVPVAILQRQIQSAKTPEQRELFEKKLFELHQGRQLVIKSMQQIVEKCTDSKEATQQVLHGRSQAYTTREYKEVVEHYREKCFNWHETKYQSSMDHLYLFANLLEMKVSVERIKNAIEEVGAAMRAETQHDKEY